MVFTARLGFLPAGRFGLMALASTFLVSCAGLEIKGMAGNRKHPKEYFAESEYGVKASPRVSWKKTNLPRGGGRDQTGKPYMVRGRMYYPKEEKNYRKTGLASWYGDAFHGRLTANGEIYDSTHLTGAHPTMPLPSYARVTNLTNGNSVIVRVNDRGPYSDDRLIDLSKRAAEMLDYTRTGTAKVKVEYVGRAPLDGSDDQYLLASYRPGNGASDPSDGLPTGVMIAMDGPTPSSKPSRPQTPVFATAPFEETVATSVQTASFGGSTEIQLPAFGPIVPKRPTPDRQLAFAVMSYAPQDLNPAVDALAALGARASSHARSDARTLPQLGDSYATATVSKRVDAESLGARLSQWGRVVLDVSTSGGADVYSVSVFSDGRLTIDGILEAAWRDGAPDAIVVRD